MIRKIQTLYIIGLLVSIYSYLPANPGQGRGNLIYTYSAKTLKKEYLDLTLGTRYYGKVASFGAKRKAYTMWNVQGVLSLNYGMKKHLELILTPYFYQDNNKGAKGFSKESINVPDDIFVGIKLGSFSSYESPWQFGGLISIRIPSARYHNIIYESYSAGRLEFGLTGLVSYFNYITNPEESWSLHFNLSYLNHNDVGAELTESDTDPNVESMSTELIGRIGFMYPMGTFDFSVEVEGRYFVVRPPVTAYSREYLSYLTLGVYYKPYRYLMFQMGLDIKLLAGEDISEYISSGKTMLPPPPTDAFPNYPGWRSVLGAKIALAPKSLYLSEESLLKRQARDRKSLLRKMIREQEDTEDAEAELSRIRAERKRVEEELERLRKLLEGGKKGSE